MVAISVVIAIALIPYLGVIGVIAIALLCVLVLCGVSFAVVFTYTSIIRMHRGANIINSGDVVVYLKDGKLTHLSAIHEHAKIGAVESNYTDDNIREDFANGNTVKQIAKSTGISEEKVSKAVVDDETIMSLYNAGSNITNIAKSIGVSRYIVQKTVERLEKAP
jgi:biotin operon repressor